MTQDDERYRQIVQITRDLAQHIEWLLPFLNAKAKESGDVAGLQSNARQAAETARRMIRGFEAQDLVKAQDLRRPGGYGGGDVTWKKIYSAPKDRRILVFVPDTGWDVTSGIFTAQWFETSPIGWFESGYLGLNDEAAIIDGATHWRELTESPSDMVVAT